MTTSAQISPSPDLGEQADRLDGNNGPDPHEEPTPDDRGIIVGGPADAIEEPVPNFTFVYHLPWQKEPMVVQRKFADKALGFLTPDNTLRQWAVRLALHPAFDSFILVLILLNAAFMLVADYDKIYADVSRDNPRFGELDPSGSPGNKIQLESDIYFTVAFTIELIIKVIARGFYGEPGCYISDSWNQLDLLVVVTAWVPLIFPDLPSISVIRTFRVLRPLKSISALPELQKIIVAMLKAIPQLMYVVGLLIFTYTIFGILGLQLFSGNLHQRCRLTPFPVQKEWVPGMDPYAYACLSEASQIKGPFGDPTEHNVDTWSSAQDMGYKTKKSSPWFEGYPQCYWPVDESVTSFCNLENPNEYDPHSFHCYHGRNESQWTFCGSDFDFYGNKRFKSSQDVAPYMDKSIYIEDMFWGFMNFDNLARGLLTIFQSVTMEAWSDIMYFCMDSSGYVTSGVYFVLLMLLGSFFALNLVLAVLEGAFNDDDDDDGASKGSAAGEEEGSIVEADKEPHDEAREGLQEAAGFAKDKIGGVEQSRESHKYSAQGVKVFPERSDQYSVGDTPSSLWERFSAFIQDEDSAFTWFATGLIVLNTIVLAMDKYPSEEAYEHNLNVVNLVLTYTFAGEMVLKLGVMGPKAYAADRFNLFDALVVIISFVELGLADSGNGGGLTALRSFRLFRIFRLARKWATMQRLLTLIVTTLIDVSNFLLLVTLFIFIYAMLGIEFFANRMHFDAEGHAIPIGATGYHEADIPRHNFDTVLNAIVTVYQILSGENWNVVMYDGWRATNWVSTLYFVSLVIFGAMFVMNLFLAILLNNFELVDPEPPAETLSETTSEEAEKVDGQVAIELTPQQPALEGQKSVAVGVTEMQNDKSRVAASKLSRVVSQRKTNATMSEHVGKLKESCTDHIRFCQGLPKLMTREALARQVASRTAARLEALNSSTRSNDNDDPVFPLKGNSLGVFSPEHPVRHFVALVVDHPYFDRTILALIVISSVLLAIDSPFLDPAGDLKKFLDVMDIIMTVLFSVEMGCKFVAVGLYRKSGGGYFSSGWNILDFVVVCVSIVSLTPAGENLSWFKAIRTLRTLRPLRMINRAPGLKVIVNSILASIPEIGNVTAVCLFMFLIFAIFSVNYFKGTLRSCQGPHFESIIAPNATLFDLVKFPQPWEKLSNSERALFGPGSVAFSADAMATDFYQSQQSVWDAMDTASSQPLCEAWTSPKYPATYPLASNFDYETDKPTSRLICECWGGEWDMVVDQNFDNAIWAFLTLFEISTTEGWVDVMWAVVDSRGIDMEPIRDAQPAWVFFFMLFIFLGSYLFLNLFVGVTIDNFNRIKAQKDGESLFMTPTQRLWVDTIMVSVKFNLKRTIQEPVNPLGKISYWLVVQEPQNIHFEKFIMACIVLNTLVMAITWFGQPDEWTMTTEVLNLVFAAIFTIEAALKLLAMGKVYFHDSWNNFDFAIVILTLVGIILDFTGTASIGSMASIVRTFRVGRAIRLIQGLTEVKRLFKTLMLSLPAVMNILTLLVLLFFIFTIVGVQLFATVAFQGANDQHTNLRYFSRTFIVLLRFATGENWNGFMHSVAGDVEGCVTSPSYDAKYCGFNDNFDCEPLVGCGNGAIYMYMVLFNVIVAFVFVNLFIGVILEGFDNANDSFKLVTDADFQWFSSVWKHPSFDPRATCYLSPHLLPAFSRMLLCNPGVHNTTFEKLRDAWRFHDSKSVTHSALEAFIQSLHTQSSPIKIIDHEGADAVHFKNVLLAFVRQAARLQLEAAGKASDIDRIESTDEERIIRNIVTGAFGTATAENFETGDHHYTLQHRHAAVVIYRAVLRWNQEKHRHGCSMRSVQTQASTSDQSGVGRPQTPLTYQEWERSPANGMRREKPDTSEASSQTDEQGTPRLGAIGNGVLGGASDTERQVLSLPHIPHGSGEPEQAESLL